MGIQKQACSAGKNSESGQIRVRQFEQCQNSDEKLMSDIPFFGLDNSDEGKFGSKSGSDNRNVKSLMSGFKIRTKNSCPYLIFFRSDKFGCLDRTQFCQHYKLVLAAS